MDQSLQGGVARFEVVDVLFVYPLTSMIGVRIVNTFCTVDRSAGCATGCITIALISVLHVSTMQDRVQAFYERGQGWALTDL